MTTTPPPTPAPEYASAREAIEAAQEYIRSIAPQRAGAVLSTYLNVLDILGDHLSRVRPAATEQPAQAKTASVDISALIERADEAIYLLRNGGDDDPYVIPRPENIEGDEDDGQTRIEVADGQDFCSVAANEGQPEIGVAHAIAGAGKLINDLRAALIAALATPPAAAAEHRAQTLKVLRRLVAVAPHEPTCSGGINEQCDCVLYDAQTLIVSDDDATPPAPAPEHPAVAVLRELVQAADEVLDVHGDPASIAREAEVRERARALLAGSGGGQ